MSGEAVTPPHQPTYNVRLSPGRINDIVSALYADHTANVTEAPRGTSYNNRIYFLDIAWNLAVSLVLAQPFKAVLKLSGHFFDHTKIENEVVSLLLLARHCPSLPVPLVLAWSVDGRTISTYDKTIPDSSCTEGEKRHGWILMTHLPGRTLTTTDLDSEHGSTILQQIAKFNVSWRKSIPSLPMFGNIRSQSPEEARHSNVSLHQALPLHQAYTVGGFLLCHRYDPAPITTALDYYTYMLKDQIHRVMTCKAYDDVRCDIVPLIADLVERDLPQLSCTQPKNGQPLKAVFSHMDLAPRNVLVQENERGMLNVTGMIDFEFAAFLPELDEFVNAFVRQEGDWTEKHYRLLLQEMGRLGCEVPPMDGLEHGSTTFSDYEWKETCLLWKLIDNIAPWYIMEGKMSNEELEKELVTAGKTVRECFKSLQKLRKMKQERLEPKAISLGKILH